MPGLVMAIPPALVASAMLAAGDVVGEHWPILSVAVAIGMQWADLRNRLKRVESIANGNSTKLQSINRNGCDYNRAHPIQRDPPGPTRSG